jgi:hypothetical protein
MSVVMSRAEAVCEALAGLAAALANPETPEEVSDSGRAVAMVAEDLPYTFGRGGDGAAGTGLHPGVAERFHQAAARAKHNASAVDESLNYDLVMTRR